MNCTHDQEALILYYYDELTAPEAEVLRARLAQCPACQHAWQKLQADMQVMDGLVKPPPVNASDLQRVRAVPVAPRQGPARVQVLRWVASVAAALLIFVTGWYLGAVDNDDKWADSVRFDSDTQLVRIEYEDDESSPLTGSIHDAPMQRELGVILASDIDPLNRMRAARALAHARIAPNVRVSSVLEGVLASDENPVVRLQAVRALNRLYSDRSIPESLRSVLLDRVETDANTAVRMKAMELLVASEQVSMDTRDFMERVGSDSRENPYIRFMAHSSLERLTGQ